MWEQSLLEQNVTAGEDRKLSVKIEESSFSERTENIEVKTEFKGASVRSWEYLNTLSVFYERRFWLRIRGVMKK